MASGVAMESPHKWRGLPAPKAHLALLILSFAPIVLPIPTNANIILTAALCVYIGAWRSVKSAPPSEHMSQRDAMRFPFIGSLVLFSLFLVFKFLPKDLVNMVLTLYFVALGALAVSAAILPFVNSLFSQRLQEGIYEVREIQIPYIVPEPTDFSVTLPELLAGSISVVLCGFYFLKKHWFLNNALGLTFSITGIEHLSLGATQTGIILLAGLFFYDIFWVFCTPVMVTVAKSFDAPIKLLFPRYGEGGSEGLPMSMLGLGDIVIPGIFVALILRYDFKHKNTSYFQSAFWGYVGGLGTTIFVMNYFQAAQPALLYIVPAVLGAVGFHALYRKEFLKLFNHSEEEPASVVREKEEAAGIRDQTAPAVKKDE